MSSRNRGHRLREPSHRLYRVVGKGQAARFIPIGAAWPTRDGRGFTVSSDLVPLQGQLVLRPITDDENTKQSAPVDTSTAATVAIRGLNDEFRRLGPLMGRAKFDGLWVFSGGVQAEGPDFTFRALTAAQVFNKFDDTPNDTHAFGEIVIDGMSVIWTIDYLTRGTAVAAADATNNATAARIITIMLANEA